MFTYSLVKVLCCSITFIESVTACLQATGQGVVVSIFSVYMLFANLRLAKLEAI